jgi:hypothetical protein
LDPRIYDLDEIIEEFGIEIIETSQINITNVNNRNCRLLKTNLPYNVYILETPSLIRYASFPHICGEPLVGLLRDPGISSVISQFSLERFGRPIVYGKIGEMIVSYPGNPKGPGDIALISVFPDVRPGILHEIKEEVSSKGGRLRVLLVMGFLSIEDLRKIEEEASSEGIDAIFISFLLLGREASGELYAYGYDKGALRRGLVREVGCMIDLETLKKLIPEYPPSTNLILSEERISGSMSYLNSLLESILFLLEHPIFDSWQIENLLREAKSVKREMMRRMRG